MTKKQKQKSEIAYQNKDITSKLYAESLKEKSFQVYGVNLPKVKDVWPTNLPRMIVLYTCDVERDTVKLERDLGCLKLHIEAGFLSEIDTDEVYQEIQNKINSQEPLTSQDAMKLEILPLTVKGKKEKENMVFKAVELARLIENEKQEIEIISGIITFSDKIISKEYSNQLKEEIMMTKVGKLFEKEKLEAVEKTKEEIARNLKKAGTSIQAIKDATGLSEEEIEKL